MELYNKISLALGSIGTALGLVNLIRQMRAEGVRFRVELTGRRLQDATESGLLFINRSRGNLSAGTTGSKENTYIFVITVSNLSNFPVVVKDLRVAVSDERLSWKGRMQLRYSRFQPGGWSSYIKFELGRRCPLTVPSNSTITIEEEMMNSLIVEERWLIAYLRLENGKDAFSNNYCCGDILESFEIYTPDGEGSRAAARAIVAFGNNIEEWNEWQRQNPGMTIFKHDMAVKRKRPWDRFKKRVMSKRLPLCSTKGT
jgi:hypothetical protein